VLPLDPSVVTFFHEHGRMGWRFVRAGKQHENFVYMPSEPEGEPTGKIREILLINAQMTWDKLEQRGEA
jgi:hypothetical protein